MSVLVVLEQREGKFHRVSLEALSAARALAQQTDTTVTAVVLGAGAAEAAAEAVAYLSGNGQVLTVEAPELVEYTPDAWTDALQQIVHSEQPRVVIFPHTYQVRDYAPKLATRFGRSLVSDAVDVSVDGDNILCVRQLFQGKLQASVAVNDAPAFVSVQAGAFRAAEKGADAADVKPFAVKLDSARVRSHPEAPYRESQRSVDLGAANLIVAVGRGIQSEDKLPLIKELAEAMGAELAASRPICDNGWLPMERQVGSSGQTVAPKLYLAVGISGAIQHLVGMKGAKTIVAINKDETAPIFESADYAVVGDLFEIVPALVDEIRKTKA